MRKPMICAISKFASVLEPIQNDGAQPDIVDEDDRKEEQRIEQVRRRERSPKRPRSRVARREPAPMTAPSAEMTKEDADLLIARTEALS